MELELPLSCVFLTAKARSFIQFFIYYLIFIIYYLLLIFIAEMSGTGATTQLGISDCKSQIFYSFLHFLFIISYWSELGTQAGFMGLELSVSPGLSQEPARGVNSK